MNEQKKKAWLRARRLGEAEIIDFNSGKPYEKYQDDEILIKTMSDKEMAREWGRTVEAIRSRRVNLKKEFFSHVGNSGLLIDRKLNI